MSAVQELAPHVGQSAACRALSVPRASWYRGLQPVAPPAARPTPARALPPAERQTVLDHLHSERFRDKSPAEAFATLLDEGVYLCSVSSMYRLLAESGEVRERRDQLRHPEYKKPELLATAPNQVWSWDITKLLGPAKWTYFYLYVILDIFRWDETAGLAETVKLFRSALQGAKGDQPMKKDSRKAKCMDKPAITVGLDVGDRFSRYCVLNEDGEVVEEGKIQTTEVALQRHFDKEPRQRIALECGTHSPWISRLLERLGHQVIVANARKIRAITASESKNDRNDAEKLAHFAYCDPFLLSPIRHRSPERQQDLNLIQVRSTLVRARTMVINSVRGLVKSAGGRLPKCSTADFAKQALPLISAELALVVAPLVEQVGTLTDQIRRLDKQIENLSQRYVEIKLLRTAPGVGPVIAAAYVLTLDSPDTVANSRQAGAFLGLRPRQSQSGDSNPQHSISKTGNIYLRSLLVQSAHYILGRFGQDCELRRWGLKLAASGGKRGKKRAIVAVARKLAVILHAMWRSGHPFEPFLLPATTAVA